MADPLLRNASKEVEPFLAFSFCSRQRFGSQTKWRGTKVNCRNILTFLVMLLY